MRNITIISLHGTANFSIFAALNTLRSKFDLFFGTFMSLIETFSDKIIL